MVLTTNQADDKIKKAKRILTIDRDGNISALQKLVGRNIQEKNRNKLNINYLNIGYYILTPLLLGVFLGLAMDRLFDTKPIFTAFLLALGTIACFYNLIKLLKNGG